MSSESEYSEYNDLFGGPVAGTLEHVQRLRQNGKLTPTDDGDFNNSR